MRLLALCLLAAAAMWPLCAPAAAAPPALSPAQVWVARRSWHIDLGLAVDQLNGPLREVAARFPGARYLFFGFGDRRYLTAKRRGALTLSGALWPGAGLTLVTAIEGSPLQAFGAQHALALSVSEGELTSLQEFIGATLAMEQGAPRVIKPGPYEGSLYLEALPRYSARYTCNTWAAQGLAAAGLPIHTRLVVLAGQLWSQVRKLERQAPYAGPSVAGASP